MSYEVLTVWNIKRTVIVSFSDLMSYSNVRNKNSHGSNPLYMYFTGLLTPCHITFCRWTRLHIVVL